MRVGWRRLSIESAGVGEKRLWLTGLPSGVTTDPADPAMRGGGGGGQWGPKNYGINFLLKISQGNYHADVRCDE